MKLKTHLNFLFFFIFCGLTITYGQGLCDRGGGGFTLDKNAGCAPLSVSWTNNVANPFVLGYNVLYDGVSSNPSFQNTSSYQYQLPGNYTILQQVSTSSGLFYHCEKVTVSESRTVNLISTSCGGGKINLLLTQDAILNAYSRLQINWGDGKVEEWKKGDALNLEHIYEDTNTKPVIKVQGFYDGTGACKEGLIRNINVTFQQAQLNNIQITAVEMRQNGNLNFSFNGIGGIKTQVQYSTDGGANFTNGDSWTLGGINTFSIKSLSKDQSYTVRLLSMDNCGEPLASKQITSMAIKAESSNGTVKLSWNKYPISADFRSYELYRNGNLLETFNDIDDISFTDTDVDCGDFEVYYVKTILVGASSQSAEEAIRVDNSGSLGLEKASVSVSENGVLILAEAAGKSYDLTIERAESKDGLFRRIMILNSQNEYLDNSNIQPSERSYCYKLSYSSCGKQYPTTPALCTILLEKKHSTFTWSNHLPFLNPVESYTMLQTGSSGSTQEVSVDQNVPYTPKLNSDSDPEYTFQIKAVSDDGKMESLSNAITFKRSADVFFPTAFSPNGDFKNDDIKPVATELASYNFTIYNRWGGVVFHTEDQTVGWDGTIKNQLAELGWYLYKVSFMDELNQKVEKRGTFMLLR